MFTIKLHRLDQPTLKAELPDGSTVAIGVGDLDGLMMAGPDEMITIDVDPDGEGGWSHARKGDLRNWRLSEV